MAKEKNQLAREGMGVPRVVVALDYPDLAEATALVDRLCPFTSWFKIGCQLFARYGRHAVDELRRRGCDVFVDLKVNGLPNTDSALARAILEWQVQLVDIHSTLGERSMRHFMEGLGREGQRPCVLGVTVLTSHSGVGSLDRYATRAEMVLRLATRARDAGLDGVVASAGDVGCLKRHLGQDFLVVTPGIRPVGAALDEQRQVATPKSAAAAGVDFMVIGRPITRAASPVCALRSILEEVEEARATGSARSHPALGLPGDTYRRVAV